ncbi:MAG: dihydropteroate synthase [Deltaproteobacteria bacterium]|nr:dihydropteroate synthase [Deltaproteobacteria bacterium]
MASGQIRWRRGLLSYAGRTLVMGVVNVTPDSFSDGGLYLEPDKAISRGLELEDEGAAIIDVGGESTRPGARPIPAEEELRRVLPVVEGLARRLSIPLSIDTYKARVAEQAIAMGASMVNDISGLQFDAALAGVVARAGVPVVLSHIQGTPETMQRAPRYADLLGEVKASLQAGIALAERAGVSPDAIIVDPGIGFGKTAAHNLELLRRLSELQALGRPVLVGPSRKSFIGRVLGADGLVEEGTAAAVVAAILHGANLVRVHDVARLRWAVRMADAIKFGVA